MKTLDLDAIEARASAATPGPWEWRRDDLGAPVSGIPSGTHAVLRAEGCCDACYNYPHVWGRDVDREFVAAAREDVPALVARIRELEAAAALTVAKASPQPGTSRLCEAVISGAHGKRRCIRPVANHVGELHIDADGLAWSSP